MDSIDVNLHKLFQACAHETRLCSLVLALLETQGYSEVPCGAEVLGQAGDHIEQYREQFRVALGLAQPVSMYEEEEES
jgi:hypothetical protein